MRPTGSSPLLLGSGSRCRRGGSRCGCSGCRGACVRAGAGCRRAGSRCGGARTAAIAKVGDIPAGALQLKSCCRDLLDERSLSAGGAITQRRIRYFLQCVVGMAARVAFVSVYRHEIISKNHRPNLRFYSHATASGADGLRGFTMGAAGVAFKAQQATKKNGNNSWHAVSYRLPLPCQLFHGVPCRPPTWHYLSY